MKKSYCEISNCIWTCTEECEHYNEGKVYSKCIECKNYYNINSSEFKEIHRHKRMCPKCSRKYK